MQVKDATVLVTGAASGLGFETASFFAGLGAKVIGLDLAASIEKVQGAHSIDFVAGDVTSETDVNAALQKVPATKPLRVVVNCAGIAPAGRILGSKGPHDLDLYRKTIEVNLVGTFNVMRLAAKIMAASEPLEHEQRGVIINTASIAAYEGQIGQAAYASSKAGVVGLTITAARDLARHGIRVVTIAPGIVDTPMLASLGAEVQDSLAKGIPFPKRLAQAAEFAQLAHMIVEHDYLNGETIRMDGALRMAPQ